MSQSGVLQGITLKKGIYEINGNIIFNSCSFEDGITLKVNDLRQIRMTNCFFKGSLIADSSLSLFDWIKSKIEAKTLKFQGV